MYGQSYGTRDTFTKRERSDVLKYLLDGLLPEDTTKKPWTFDQIQRYIMCTKITHGDGIKYKLEKWTFTESVKYYTGTGRQNGWNDYKQKPREKCSLLM